MLSAPNPQSHAALVQQARSGSLAAFDCLVEAYQDAIFDLAHAILGNFHQTEVTAQEAFIQAWRNLKQLLDDPPISASSPYWAISGVRLLDLACERGRLTFSILRPCFPDWEPKGANPSWPPRQKGST